MTSAFGVEHMSKAYYHSSYEQLQQGQQLQTATARGHNTDHLPEGEKWRNDRVWATKSKRKSAKWAKYGDTKPTNYKVKLAEDAVKHRPTKYDGRIKGRGQYHASGGVVQ